MPSEEFTAFLSELPHWWGNREAFASRDEFIARVRASTLTANEIGQLRDSLVDGGAGSTGQRINTIRGMLNGLYQERIRREEAERSSWLLRFVRDHPAGAFLSFLLAAVVTALVGLVIGVVFEQPIRDWWQGHPEPGSAIPSQPNR
jgi:hypothetical protein